MVFSRNVSNKQHKEFDNEYENKDMKMESKPSIHHIPKLCRSIDPKHTIKKLLCFTSFKENS